MISDRKLTILKLIIDDYISNNHPVGSRTISKLFPEQISSATIRNEMADLEELGYLLQPHTSAGRIPSDLGYRLYVDALMNDSSLGTEQRHLVRDLLLNKIIEPSDIANQSAQLIANMTNKIVLVSLPQLKRSRVENMKLIRVSEKRVLWILVTDAGVVKSIPLSFNGASQELLDSISNVMLTSLRGLEIGQITARKILELKFLLASFEQVVDYLIPILKDALNQMEDNDIFIAGKNSIFDMEEYKEPQEAQQLLELLDNKSVLDTLFDYEGDRKVDIRIGQEIGVEGMEYCSVVGTKYRINGKYNGKIVVLGPKRMDYSQVFSVVEFVERTLSDLFAGIYL